MNPDVPSESNSVVTFRPIWGWPPRNWYRGADDHQDGELVYDFAPPPSDFTPADALCWLDHTIQYLEYLGSPPLAEPEETAGDTRALPVGVGPLTITPDGRPERTPVHNARLVVDDLCRRERLPPPPPVYPDPDCRLQNDLRTLHVLRDWLRRVVDVVGRVAAETGPPGRAAPFTVRREKDDRYFISRKLGDEVEKVQISLEAYTYLTCLLEVPPGVPVKMEAVASRLGVKGSDLRIRDFKDDIPDWAWDHIQRQPGTGSWLRTDSGGAEPESGRG